MYVPKIRKLNEEEVQQLKVKYEIIELNRSLPLIYVNDPIIKNYNMQNSERIEVGDVVISEDSSTPLCIIE
jgi:DNA-directed RNA polymerase subunit H (RpoH/RPB5)